ncbi:MAG: N-acetylmuramoyl-L-alanine amidase [Pseudomonadota bacterium]|nr:N-acetylmuramoyl-L-alanine amidase [Pseudomonadota bacterium]
MRCLSLLFLLLPLAVGAKELRDVRVWAGPETTRVVFDLSAPTEHKVFSLVAPERVVIDLDGVERSSRLAASLEGSGLVQRIRTGRRPDGALRVVLDLSEAVRPKSFALTPNGDYGYRLVVDLGEQGTLNLPEGRESTTIAAAAPEQQPAPEPAPPAPQIVEVPAAQAPLPAAKPRSTLYEKPIVIAIDAGHGGKDSGARGSHGVLEKDVALSMARRLAKLVNAQPGYQAVLTRDSDTLIALRERMNIARDAQADLFVSIHANAYKDSRVNGSAVYALSHRGATSEQARWLANKENSADLIGGVELSGKDDTLAAVLFDISQTSAIEASIDVGGRILESLGGINKLQRTSVQQAGFVVLKSPDIPSVLVETAFITNPKEEKLLNDSGYQATLAKAIFKGVQSYFQNYRPLRYVSAPANSASRNNHTVRSGDTLSEVAQLYQVSLNDLRSANGLNGDRLKVGEVLQIPVAH